MKRRRLSLIALIGPGVLVAATGVGAGDLATAGLAGAELGLAVAWAVILGAFLKLVLTENLARHQLATGSTILESAIARLGWFVYIPFGVYLIAWSYFVGAALIAANATTLVALFNPTDADTARPILAAAASAAGLGLAMVGGFKLFERIMAVCIAVMVAVVVAAAVLTKPSLTELIAGLTIPRIPDLRGEGLGWTVALMGGVGGTLTILCYSYWMRDAGRTDTSSLKLARIDISIGYAMTALFGVAMLVIAAPLDPQGSGSRLIVNLADQLGASFANTYGPTTGTVARYAFLIGALGAVFSSLLGVWQAVPYVFADWWASRRRIGRPEVPPPTVSTRSPAYLAFMVLLATVPLISLSFDFSAVQKIYAIVGAAFVPGLALVLLILNNKRSTIPDHRFRNRPLSNAVLLATLVLTAALAIASQTT